MQLEAKTIKQGDSTGWLVWHDTDGNGSLADLSPDYTCRLVVVGTTIDRSVTALGPAYDGAAADTAFIVGITPGESAALAVGQYVVSVKITNTAIGFSGEQHGILTVESAAPAITVPTDADNLRADLAVVDATMRKFMAGELVKEVSRDGRRIVKDNPTFQQLTDHREFLLSAITAAESAASGRPRRRAITLAYRN